MPRDKKPRDTTAEAQPTEEQKEQRTEADAVDVTELKNSLTEARQKAEDYLDAARRIQAEFDNFRKRNAQVRADAYEDGARDFVTAMLPVYDNFERAVASADEAGDTSPLAEGVRMLRRSFWETLEKQGVKAIEALPGSAFDPNLHNAVLTSEPTEACPAGTIAMVMQKGYTMHDKPVRIAMVSVSHDG